MPTVSIIPSDEFRRQAKRLSKIYDKSEFPSVSERYIDQIIRRLI